jgi:hypothetical protein
VEAVARGWNDRVVMVEWYAARFPLSFDVIGATSHDIFTETEVPNWPALVDGFANMYGLQIDHTRGQ